MSVDFIILNYGRKKASLIITEKVRGFLFHRGGRVTKTKRKCPYLAKLLFLNKYISWYDTAPPEKGREMVTMVYLRKEFKRINLDNRYPYKHLQSVFSHIVYLQLYYQFFCLTQKNRFHLKLFQES